MYRIASFAVVLWLLISGVGMAASDLQILSDHEKLGKSYPIQTRTKLTDTVKQLLLEIRSLPPKTTLQDAAKRRVQAAFPKTIDQPEIDAYVFWVVTEAAKGAKQDYQELLAQKTFVENRQQEIVKLLTHVHRKLGRDQSGKPADSNNIKAQNSKRSAMVYTKNMRLPFHPVPKNSFTTKIIDEVPTTELPDIESKLETIGDDAQLANVDLQNTLQKQQQTLQMLSTISKLLHDTAMAVIRKIGG